MAAERWIFTRSQLENTPSRRCGIDSDKELNYRQHTANFIQEMGQKLQVSQLTINTAIVFMHRFYMFHSFQRFTRNNIGTACLFLAAKVEEQPRKLEHLIRMAHQCQNPGTPPLDVKSESYLEMAQELVVNENILLQTLGFNLHVDHPHSYVVKTTQMVRASKDLAQASYFLATNSLHLTTMCLQQPSAHVACVCIHIACKWSDLEIPRSSEGKEWFQYTDKDMTFELLEELTTEFLAVLDKCPSKLKKKILTWKKDAGSGSQEVDGPPAKKVKHEVSAAAGSAAQAGSQRPHDSQRVKMEHRGEHHDMKQRPPGYNAHSNPSGHDPSRVKLESGHHGSRPDHHIKREPGVDHHIKREPGYHEKREPGYHDQAKRDPNLHHVKLENPASRHPHAPAPQDAGMRRIKTEPSLSLTPKEYMERREKEKALQAMHQRSHRPGEQHRPTDPFKAPGSSDRHHLDPVARMKERSSHHGAPPGSEQHRKEQHRQRPMPQKSGSEHKSKLTSPPPNSVKAQSNMSDMLEREIQRQQQHLHKSHGSSTQPAAQVSDSFRSQHEQKQRPPTKERDGIFSSIELQKSTVTKPVGSENKRPSGEKPGEVQKSTRSHDLPPLNISPAKNRARTSSSSSDISPTVAKMRKDDRRLSQDPIVHIKPLPSEIDVKSPTKPVAPDIMAFCEQAAAGSVSPVPQPSPAKPGSQSIKMKLGLKTPTKSEKTNNNNGEVSGENVSERGHRMKDERSVQKDFIKSREHNASSSLKKEKSFERHERKSKDHKAAEKAERSDLKLKISLGGHGNSPNVKAVKNEDAKKHASSPTSLTTSDGLKLKIKLNSSEQGSASGSHGSEKERHETKSQSQEQKPLKMVLKLPSGISSTPPPVEEKERHQHHHRHHKKHKHKDRHKEDRHSRKRAHSPGDGSHHSTSHHSSSSHHPPSSKVPRSDAAHYNNMNTHGNGRHPEGGGSNRNSPALLQVQETLGLLNSVMKQKSMDLKRNMERERHLANAPPLPPGDPYYPTPPPPPPSNVPPLPPGPPPQ